VNIIKKMKNKKLIKRKIKEKKSLKQWKDSSKCMDCKSTKNLTLHHIIPKSVGGIKNKSNLITLCRNCHNKEHQRKNKKWTGDYRDLDLIKVLRQQGYDFKQIENMIG